MRVMQVEGIDKLPRRGNKQAPPRTHPVAGWYKSGQQPRRGGDKSEPRYEEQAGKKGAKRNSPLPGCQDCQ